MLTTKPLAHRRSNRFQSVLIMLGMASLLSICGFVFAGKLGLVLAILAALAVVAISGRASPALILRMYKAAPIDVQQMPELVATFRELCRRSGLEESPRLFYVPSKMLNAFAVGRGEHAAVALTHGLLASLNLREIAGVLGHELSHIRNRDLWVMGLADSFSRLTTSMGQAGQLMLLFGIPATLAGAEFPWLGVLALLIAPTGSGLLQLALSRSREYEADLGAAQLTGDPMGLASALRKIDHAQAGWLQKILLPGRKVPEASLLRTHPPTEERIARLTTMVETPPFVQQPLAQERPELLVSQVDFPIRKIKYPRWHVSGLWY